MKPTGVQRKIVRMDKSELAHRRSTLIPRGLDLAADLAVRRPVRVLIVDDFDTLRENLRQRVLDLDQQIAVVGEAATGAGAVRRYREVRPDVVTMDINMPDMDGMSATEHICSHYPNARIIMLTIQSQPEYVLRSMRAGAMDYYVLPPLAEELLAAIRKLGSYQLNPHGKHISHFTRQIQNTTTEGMVAETDELGTHFATFDRWVGEASTALEALALRARAFNLKSPERSLIEELVDGASRARKQLERVLEELDWPEEWDSGLVEYANEVMDRIGPRALLLGSRSRLKYVELVLGNWHDLRLPESKYRYWLGNCISDSVAGLSAIVDWRLPER